MKYVRTYCKCREIYEIYVCTEIRIKQVTGVWIVDCAYLYKAC